VTNSALGRPPLFESAFVFSALDEINKSTNIEVAAHERRRTTTIASPLPIREYTRRFNEKQKEALIEHEKPKGVSSSYIYHHMVPVRKDSLSGQRHKPGATLKSMRPKAMFHSFYENSMYCRSIYFEQLRRCDDITCCPPMEPTIASMLQAHKGWFPTPVPSSGESNSWKSFSVLIKESWIIPDTHCPSVKREKLTPSRYCDKCHCVFTSKESFLRHVRFLHNKQFILRLSNNQISTILSDHQPIDAAEEQQLEKEKEAYLHTYTQMGFVQKEGSLARQIKALTLAGATYPNTPRLRRASLPVVL